MRSWIVFRKTLREITRDKWMLGLTLAFAPFFVFLYWLWFQGGSTGFDRLHLAAKTSPQCLAIRR